MSPVVSEYHSESDVNAMFIDTFSEICLIYLNGHCASSCNTNTSVNIRPETFAYSSNLFNISSVSKLPSVSTNSNIYVS